jgi:hypothetical protein
MEYGYSWYAMMNNDGAFASPRSSANTAAIAISLQDLLSQPTKIFVVLPFQGVAGCTKTERKDLLASASAMQRPLYSGLRRVILQCLPTQQGIGGGKQ